MWGENNMKDAICMGYTTTQIMMTKVIFNTKLEQYNRSEMFVHIIELEKGMYIHRKNKPTSKGTVFTIKKIETSDKCIEVMENLKTLIENYLSSFGVNEFLKEEIVGCLADLKGHIKAKKKAGIIDDMLDL